MPTHKESKKWRVVLVPYYDINAIKTVLRRISPLFNAQRDKMTPAEWWTEGTYYTHPKAPKAVAVIFQVPVSDPVGLVFRAAALLENNHNMVLSWAGGKSGEKTYLLVKTMAYHEDSGRRKVFRLDRKDLQHLLYLVSGKSRSRAQERERKYERTR